MNFNARESVCAFVEGYEFSLRTAHARFVPQEMLCHHDFGRAEQDPFYLSGAF
jgi:hypothetical protein